MTGTDASNLAAKLEESCRKEIDPKATAYARSIGLSTVDFRLVINGARIGFRMPKTLSEAEMFPLFMGEYQKFQKQGRHP